MQLEPREDAPLPTGRLRIPLSAATQNFVREGPKFTISATPQELKQDTIINKWAMFENPVTIGKFRGRRDVVQTMREPSGILARLGAVAGDLVDVIIDQEYFVLTNVNENTGAWLSTRRFDIGKAILAYARMLNPWSEHLAVRARWPQI